MSQAGRCPPAERKVSAPAEWATGAGDGSRARALTSAHESTPRVPAEPYDEWLFRVRCPWCHQHHYHGRAGGYGHRIAHCNEHRYDGPYRSYVLVPWEEAAA